MCILVRFHHKTIWLYVPDTLAPAVTLYRQSYETMKYCTVCEYTNTTIPKRWALTCFSPLRSCRDFLRFCHNGISQILHWHMGRQAWLVCAPVHLRSKHCLKYNFVSWGLLNWKYAAYVKSRKCSSRWKSTQKYMFRYAHILLATWCKFTPTNSLSL